MQKNTTSQHIQQDDTKPQNHQKKRPHTHNKPTTENTKNTKKILGTSNHHPKKTKKKKHTTKRPPNHAMMQNIQPNKTQNLKNHTPGKSLKINSTKTQAHKSKHHQKKNTHTHKKKQYQVPNTKTREKKNSERKNTKPNTHANTAVAPDLSGLAERDPSPTHPPYRHLGLKQNGSVLVGYSVVQNRCFEVGQCGVRPVGNCAARRYILVIARPKYGIGVGDGEPGGGRRGRRQWKG